MSMNIQAIKVPHHNRAVDCAFYQPETEAPVPAVIISHGYNGCKADAARLARYLAQRGIAAVCLSFCGGSTREPSGFGTTNMTLYTQRDDLLAVEAHLEQMDGIGNIYLYGESMGGLTSVLASVELGDRIAGMGLLYPALCVPDDWRDRFEKPENVPEVVEFWGMKLGRGFFTSMWELDVFQELPKYTGPVLILHGVDDPLAPIEDSGKAVELYQRAKLVEFPAEAHGFSEVGYRRVCELMERFVAEEEERRGA